MQTLDISSYGVEELDVDEMRNLDGGILLAILFLPFYIAAKFLSLTLWAMGYVGGMGETTIIVASALFIAL